MILRGSRARPSTIGFRGLISVLGSVAVIAPAAKAETLVERCERIWKLLEDLDPGRDSVARARAAEALGEEGWSAVVAIPELYHAMLSPDPMVQQAGQSAAGKVERGLVVGAKASLGEETAKGIPEPIGERALALFMEELRAADTEQRLRAAQGMALLLGADALQRNPGALRHNRTKGLLPRVGPIGPESIERATDALALALADPSAHVRAHAAMALAALDKRGRRALPALLRALERETDPQARHLVVVAIHWSHARDESTIGPLVGLLGRAPERTQRVALGALSEIRPLPETAVDPVRTSLLSGCDSTAEAAMVALESALSGREEALRREYAGAALHARSGLVRVAAADRLRGPSSALGPALEELVRGLCGSDAAVRGRAEDVLISLGRAASPSIPHLRRTAADPDLPREAREAAERIVAAVRDE